MLGKYLKLSAAGGAAAVALVLTTALSASAHDCYNASRSDQGNASAGANSQAWSTEYVADLIGFLQGAGLITGEQAMCFNNTYTGPASFTIHVKGANGQDGVIGENNPNTALYVNGKGIDHAFDQVLPAFAACGIQLPSEP